MGRTRTLQKLTFADKFEQALNDKKASSPNYGIRTVARAMAKGDRDRVETIRRLLNKYRGKADGRKAEVTPSEPTRHEIEAAMGLERDSLKPDGDDDEEADPAMKLRRIRAELMLLGREDLADDLRDLASARGGVA
jgi:hypothetical protein